MPTLKEFLLWAAGPGAGVITGFILSFLVENWPWYQEQSPRAKRLYFIALCFIVPLLTTGLLIAFGYMPFTVELFWAALVSGFVAGFGGTAIQARQLPDRLGVQELEAARQQELEDARQSGYQKGLSTR